MDARVPTSEVVSIYVECFTVLKTKISNFPRFASVFLEK